MKLGSEAEYKFHFGESTEISRVPSQMQDVIVVNKLEENAYLIWIATILT